MLPMLASEIYSRMFSSFNICLGFSPIWSSLFETIDTNHDNNIDFNEFLFLVAVGNRSGSLDERLDIIFDL